MDFSRHPSDQTWHLDLHSMELGESMLENKVGTQRLPFFCGVLTVLFAFQNCSQSGFEAETKIETPNSDSGGIAFFASSAAPTSSKTGDALWLLERLTGTKSPLDSDVVAQMARLLESGDRAA